MTTPTAPRFGTYRVGRSAAVFSVTRYVVLILFAVVSIIPMIWLLLAPSKTGTQLQNMSPFGFGSFDNYVLAWNNLQSLDSGVIVRWIWNSIAYTSFIVFVSVASATLAGFVLAATRFPFRQAWLIVTLIAMLVPPVALVLPLFIEIKSLGLFDSPWGVMLASSLFPFGAFLAYIYFATSIPSELYEAAKIDGCNEYQTFWWVARPLARPLLGILAFFAFVATWTNYFLPFVLLASNENYTLPLGLGVLFSATPALNPGLGATQLPIGRPEVALAGLLVALPILVVFLLSQRFLVRGMLAGGVKS
ncbi:MAG: carbohydrate ABC transporter permease [Chloroflexi bacterium]|nr:carbohydrate ABC transporter permease [Chloroflexota bacterium]